MSAVATHRRSASADALKVTQARVLRSEWIKFRSLRSTGWTLVIALTLMIGIGALFSALTASNYQNLSAADRATFGATSVSLTGTSFAVVAFGVLGVLLMSGEYGTGMIRSSLTVVPRRLPVLWAKLAVFAAAVFSLALVASLASFYLGQILLNTHHLGVSITSSGALRSVVGAALYITVAGLLGVALGGLLRNTAAGISVFAALFFVVPPLVDLLPASISDHLARYLPSYAGSAVWGGAQGVAGGQMAPWSGFGLLCGYAAILVAAAAWRLRRSDA